MTYQAPGATINHTARIVTSSDLLNAIVVQINGLFWISGSIITNAAYNGNLSIEIQKQDGTWTNVISINNPNSSINLMASEFDGSGFGSLLVAAGLEKYPFNIRIKVTLASTLGTATISLDNM